MADRLHNYLQEKAELTPSERRHLEDYRAPNYMETSLIPALAILDLEDTSSEFSPGTKDFIREQLKSVGRSSLQSVIQENQRNIERHAFSTEINSLEELQALFPEPKQDPV